ncbi:MAG: plastocyanin/azurin family copper-binding protein [Acidimicrobiia bacterium]
MRASGTHQIVVAALVAVVLAACGGSDESRGSDAADDLQPVPTAGAVDDTGVSDVGVITTGNTFRDPTIRVDAGTTVTWTNGSAARHDILDASEGWSNATPAPDDFGVDADTFDATGEYSFTFDDPGIYAYYCSIHGGPTVGMTGTVIVE